MSKLENIYTGLNAGHPTRFQIKLMEEVGFYLAMRGFVLRTRPIDNHYQTGLSDFFATKVGKKDFTYGEIYSGVSGGFGLPSYNPIDTKYETWQKATAMAKRYSSEWDILDEQTQKEMTLNIILLMGVNLDLKSAFLLYNYPSAVNNRVVLHAKRVAEAEKIKTFNTADTEVAAQILEKIRNDYLASV